MPEDNFHQSVFINCPYDPGYRHSLWALVFTLRYCGLTPRIASERLETAEVRLERIIDLILETKYSIHDFSRVKSREPNEYFRFNMPLELGLDLGCKNYHQDLKYRQKHLLIMEGERGSLSRAMSDLSGVDVLCHENESERLVEMLRNWLFNVGFSDLAGPNLIWDEFNIFNADLYQDFKKKGFRPTQITNLSFREFSHYLDLWISKRQPGVNQ